MRSVIAWFFTNFCLPRRFQKWSYDQRFRYSQRLWREVDSTIKIALAITLVFLVAVFLFSFSSVCRDDGECNETGYSYFLKARPNEVGDALAGLAGSLAFLWLITTVFLQGKELREQRKELRLTRVEFSKMAEAQEKQVLALQSQAALYEDERQFRKHSRVKDLLDQKLKTLRNRIHSEMPLVRWERSPVPNVISPTSLRRYLFDDAAEAHSLSDDDFIFHQLKFARENFAVAISWQDQCVLVKSPLKQPVEVILGVLDEIVTLSDRLSDDQIERIETIGCDGLRQFLECVLASEICGDNL